MAITIDDFSKIWASTSPLTPYAFSEDNYKQGWNFIGGTPPSRQMWDFIQKQNDEKLKYLLDNFDDYAKKTDLDDYLPLAGGTMTGVIKVSGYLAGNINNTSNVRIVGGTNASNGSALDLYGKDNSTYAGRFTIVANDGTNSKYFIGKPDGTLTWDGNNIAVGITVEIKSDNITVDGNSGNNVTIDVSKTGYTPIGVVGFRPAGSASGSAAVTSCRLEGTNVIAGVFNETSNTYTWTMYVYVLYIKS